MLIEWVFTHMNSTLGVCVYVRALGQKVGPIQKGLKTRDI